MEYQNTIKRKLIDTGELNIENLNRTFVNVIEETQRKHCTGLDKKERIPTKTTRDLINSRRQKPKDRWMNTYELNALNRNISKATREDKRNYNKKWITNLIEENKGMKVLRRRLAEGKQNITKTKDKMK